MKQINIWFEDKEHESFIDAKKIYGGNWHDFLMNMLRSYQTKQEAKDERTETKK